MVSRRAVARGAERKIVDRGVRVKGLPRGNGLRMSLDKRLVDVLYLGWLYRDDLLAVVNL